MSLWDEYSGAVQGGLDELARNTVGGAVAQARSDASAFLDASRTAFERWLTALAEGALSREDFEFLVRGQKDLARLNALTAVGLAQTRLERFRTGLISLLVSSAFKVVGP